MIARIWHGWTSKANAAAYEALLKCEVLPGIHRIRGFVGAELLRNDGSFETEFVTITYFETMEDVKEFAGADYLKAVIPTAARKLLSRFDERSSHYTRVFRID